MIAGLGRPTGLFHMGIQSRRLDAFMWSLYLIAFICQKKKRNLMLNFKITHPVQPTTSNGKQLYVTGLVSSFLFIVIFSCRHPCCTPFLSCIYGCTENRCLILSFQTLQYIKENNCMFSRTILYLCVFMCIAFQMVSRFSILFQCQTFLRAFIRTNWLHDARVV